MSSKGSRQTSGNSGRRPIGGERPPPPPLDIQLPTENDMNNFFANARQDTADGQRAARPSTANTVTDPIGGVTYHLPPPPPQDFSTGTDSRSYDEDEQEEEEDGPPTVPGSPSDGLQSSFPVAYYSPMQYNRDNSNNNNNNNVNSGTSSSGTVTNASSPSSDRNQQLQMPSIVRLSDRGLARESSNNASGNYAPRQQSDIPAMTRTATIPAYQYNPLVPPSSYNQTNAKPYEVYPHQPQERYRRQQEPPMTTFAPVTAFAPVAESPPVSQGTNGNSSPFNPQPTFESPYMNQSTMNASRFTTEAPFRHYTTKNFVGNIANAMFQHDAHRAQLLFLKYMIAKENDQIDDPPSFAFDTGDSAATHLADQAYDALSGYTLMHLAVLSGDEALVTCCLEAGSAPHSIEDVNGETPLSMAMWAQPGVVHAMLMRGRDIDLHRVNSRERNILHDSVAVTADTPPWPDRFPFIMHLVETYHVSAVQRDQFGYTPADWARDHAAYLDSTPGDADRIIKYLEDASMKAGERATLGQPVPAPCTIGGGTVKAKKSTAKKREEEKMATAVPVMHTRREVSDTISLILRGPYTRLACILILILFHNLQYAMDTVDRGAVSQVQDVRMDVAFNIVNLIGAKWNGSAFFMALVRFGFIIGGIILGVVLFTVILGRLVFQKALKLQPFGAQHVDEKRFYHSCFGGYYVKFYAPTWRGAVYLTVIGICLGIYAMARIYSEVVLPTYWAGQVEWASITPTLKGVDRVTALRGFWVTTLVLDWLVFAFVMDVMFQQGMLNVYLPRRSFACFARHVRLGLCCAFRTKRWGLELSVYAMRMTLFYVPLLLGWIAIAAAFLCVEFLKGPAREVFVNPLIATGGVAGTPIVMASLSTLMVVVIFCQEWTLPSMQEHPFLHVPGLCFSAYTGWLLGVLLTFIVSMDLRLLISQAYHYLEVEGGSVGPMIARMIPSILAGVLLIAVLTRTSLWWEGEGCCACAKNIMAMGAEHLRCLPRQMADATVQKMAKKAAQRQTVLLRQSMVVAAGRKSHKKSRAARTAAALLRESSTDESDIEISSPVGKPKRKRESIFAAIRGNPGKAKVQAPKDRPSPNANGVNPTAAGKGNGVRGRPNGEDGGVEMTGRPGYADPSARRSSRRRSRVVCDEDEISVGPSLDAYSSVRPR